MDSYWLSLTSDATHSAEKSIRCPPGGCNLIELQGDWLTWQGVPSGITAIEPSLPLNIPVGLRVPAPDAAGGRDMLVGVRRMDTPLASNTAYVLTTEVAAP
ncbi:MAG: hypothetical protein WA888_13530 [Burkholderiaceae bacterium]